MRISTDTLGNLYHQVERLLSVVERVAVKVEGHPSLDWLGLGVSRVESVALMRERQLVAHQREWKEFLYTHTHMPGVTPESWAKARRIAGV